MSKDKTLGKSIKRHYNTFSMRIYLKLLRNIKIHAGNETMIPKIHNISKIPLIYQ